MAEAAETPTPHRRARPGRLSALGGLGGRSALALLLAIVVVAAADHSRLGLDVSPDRRFSVDPELARLLAAQPTDVEVTGIWTAEMDAAAAADSPTRSRAWRRTRRGCAGGASTPSSTVPTSSASRPSTAA